MSANVEILISAQNRAKGVFRDLAGEMDEANASGGRMSGIFSGVKSILGTGFKVALGVGAAGAGALAFGLTKAIEAGSDAAEMMSAFNTVFANTSDKVSAATDKFAASVGRSKYEMRNMAMQFGDTLKPMGFTEAAAGDLSVTMSKLAVDLSSFKNMPVQEAFERLQSTLIGNHQSALAFGVIINENTLKAELARMGADKLTGSMLEQAKVQARINLLMAGTTDAQGDAARTSAGWANQMRRLQATLSDTWAEIGLELLPIFTPFLTTLGDLANQYAPRAVAAVESMANKIAGALGTFQTAFANAGGGVGGFMAGIATLAGAKVTISAEKVITIDWSGFELGFDPTKGLTKLKWGDVFEFTKTEQMSFTITKFKWFDVFEFSQKEILGITVERKLSIGDLFTFSIDSNNTIRIKIAAQPEIEMNEATWKGKLAAAGLMGMGIPIKVEPVAAKNKWKWSEIFSFDWSGWMDEMTTFKPRKLGLGDVFSTDVLRPVNIVLSVVRLGWEDVFGFDRNLAVNVSAKLTGASDWMAEWLTKKAADWSINVKIGKTLSWIETFDFSLENWQPSIGTMIAWADVFLFELFWSPAILSKIDWGGAFNFVLTDWSPKIGTMLAWGSVFGFVLSGWKPDIGTAIGWTSAFAFSLSGWMPSLGKTFAWGDVFNFSLDWFPTIHWPAMPAWLSALVGGGGGGGSSNNSAPKGHAAGTAYSSGGWTWVGERGPELVRLPTGSEVRNAVDSRRMAESGALSSAQTINVYVNNDIDVAALLYQLEDLQRRRRR